MAVQKEQKTTSKIYWAGAYIAFGVPFLGLELLGVLYQVSPNNADLQLNLRFIILFLHIAGGLVGGFLVVLKSSIDWRQGGLVTGVMAYVLEQIVHTVLYGWNSVGDGFTMAALILGSVIGAFISETRLKGKDKIPQSDEAQ